MLRSTFRKLLSILGVFVSSVSFKPQLKVVNCNGASRVSVIPLSYVSPGSLVDVILDLLRGSSNPVVLTPGVSLGSIVKRLRRDAMLRATEMLAT